MTGVSLSPIAVSARRTFLPLLALLFACSGCAALVYEIVWYQLLQMVIGSTAVSLGVLLATFMGGLCVGSMVLPRMVRPNSQHPLRLFAFIELGIAICGILVLMGLPLLSRVYVAAIGYGLPSVFLRAIVCAICLLPPTVLMGASLPAAVRWLESSPAGVSWIGLLYGANTAGAVLGCLLAGFYLLREFNLTIATFAAMAFNIAVALVSLELARRNPNTEAAGASFPQDTDTPVNWPVYTAIALSGASALGAEVVWTRLLGLLLGSTVYIFSLILAVFLVGLGLGSLAGSLILRRIARPRIALGCCQMALAAAVAWCAWMLADSLPYWPINPYLSTSFWLTSQLDLVRCLWTVLPAALLWGASFPFALAASARGGDPGRVVSRVYAANTAGAIVGALAFSIVLIPLAGTRHSQSMLIAICIASALIVLAPVLLRARSVAGSALLAVALCCGIVMAVFIPAVPGELIAYGRSTAANLGYFQVLDTAEGMNSSIAITKWTDSSIQFHVSGKVEASTNPDDMRLQRMLGHLPSLIHGQPRSVLIVGFGAGVTAGTFVLQPSIERIVICEMEPLIPQTSKRFFHDQQYDVLDDPRTQVVYDDARNYILTTPEKFDIITSDPIHPFVRGSAMLYSQEYFEMVKNHLNPGGIVTQWVPLYESDLDSVKSEIATFFKVFPDGVIFANESNGAGYDLVMLGSNGPIHINVDAIADRIAQPGYLNMEQSLSDVGFSSPLQMLGAYAGRASDLKPWLQDAQINRDNDLRLQYLAGLAMNERHEGDIYRQMLQYRVYPNGLFSVSEQRKAELMTAFQTHGK